MTIAQIERKKDLEQILFAITLPILVISIFEYDRWWKLADYALLEIMIKDELTGLV